MFVKDYLDVINTSSRMETIKRVTFITSKAFKSKRKPYRMNLWFKYNIETKKEILLLGIDNDVIYSTCTYSIHNKKDSFWYGKYVRTNKFIFLSDFTSIKKGLGKVVLLHILNIAESLSYDVILNSINKDLFKYYEQYGFKQISPYKNTMIRKHHA